MESKPQNILLKDFIIRRMVVDMGIPEKTIRTIIDDAFNNVVKATLTCKTIEISGWGVLHFNQKKALITRDKFKNQIRLFTETMEDVTTSDARRRNASMKLECAKKNLTDLELRLNEQII